MNRDSVLCGVAGLGAVVGLGAAVAGAYLVVRNLRKKSKSAGAELYETQKLVNEYLGFHFCPPEEYMRYEFGPRADLDFPKRCADLCLKYKPKNLTNNRAIDIGCSVGRSTFELAREYEEVIGVDYSEAFVSACMMLQSEGKMAYSIAVEGDLVESKIAHVDPAIDRQRTRFAVGDACELPEMGQFACVFAGNLICRLSEPANFYSRLADMVVPGGVLFITSPYTWLETYTAKDKWIGGYKLGDEEVRGFTTLKRILEPDFELVAAQDMPFVIRETVRKHQWTVAHATIWIRKQPAN